jgi:hypothetical protein
MPSFPADYWLAAPALLLFGVLIVGLFFVVRDTIRRRGNWGINLRPAECVKCGEPAPLIRKPTSFRQAMWGGWTCKYCGYELDKWGCPVADQPFPAKWAVLDPGRSEPDARPAALPADERYRSSGDSYRKGRHA